MDFQNEKVALHLEVVRYQFKDAKEECDRNWLIVKAKLSEGNKVFETMDPFLQTFDLQHMKKWFQSLPNPTYTELDFIEPNIAFELMGKNEGEFQIVVRLSQELTPSWRKEEEYEFSISITHEDREKIIRFIEEQQRNFPKR
ncbi:WapI family immunity protein [Bacillus toyonensis]|uniref:WapI family immunity protein n=1 Tax=Bacillus toyonensis TaxID=155322 RepID=UPI000BED74E2|nr:PadR family transcriptional regulator [Bacillus toyonensis]PEC38911.1 PadR family transcriptional regulator [Bacillus toyonensis]PED58837.1 PadR family transcriptional regulator [Bacillus toyonensis]PEJ90315.1 PadR family transcriptional regulator [Bacillus toyonensis]PEL02259.1 PadR family transcriptional regulator [Bacillus toyonensis]PEN31882.1 PadR family transcriptional regulator [Bacillus toyonensis]